MFVALAYINHSQRLQSESYSPNSDVAGAEEVVDIGAGSLRASAAEGPALELLDELSPAAFFFVFTSVSFAASAIFRLAAQ